MIVPYGHVFSITGFGEFLFISICVGAWLWYMLVSMYGTSHSIFYCLFFNLLFLNE